MAKTIQQIGNITTATLALASSDNKTPGLRRDVHDGDTINALALGDLGVRLLGVDAPELSLQFPNESVFTSIRSEKWSEFLAEPFAHHYPEFAHPLNPELIDYLGSKLTSNTSVNQYTHAINAEKTLESLIVNDMTELGQIIADFRIFLTFSHEVMDRYGRLLAFINRYQPQEYIPSPRPKTYNERLIDLGMVLPYFIWPNVNPFRKYDQIVDAVIKPGEAPLVAESDVRIHSTRQGTKAAREASIGLYRENDQLLLEPFELRFIARRKSPERWVIDLSSESNCLIDPQWYFTVLNPEDRLFIPAEYVPLFVEAGWERNTGQ